MKLKTSKAIRFTIQHYPENPDQTNICVGALIVNEEDAPLIQWSIVKQTVSKSLLLLEIQLMSGEIMRGERYKDDSSIFTQA